jgi:hypothetical protein
LRTNTLSSMEQSSDFRYDSRLPPPHSSITMHIGLVGEEETTHQRRSKQRRTFDLSTTPTSRTMLGCGRSDCIIFASCRSNRIESNRARVNECAREERERESVCVCVCVCGNWRERKSDSRKEMVLSNRAICYLICWTYVGERGEFFRRRLHLNKYDHNIYRHVLRIVICLSLLVRNSFDAVSMMTHLIKLHLYVRQHNSDRMQHGVLFKNSYQFYRNFLAEQRRLIEMTRNRSQLRI